MEVEKIPFADLLSDIVDNRGRTCPTAESGLPLIATNCVRNDLLYPAFEKVRHVSQETYDAWFRGHPKPGDLIFVCKGTPGRVCMTPDPVSFCIAQDMVAVRPNSKKIYPKYLFALLRSSRVQAQIETMHVGTLIPHFKKGDFDKLLLPIPNREVQETVGDMYFELSAKIELNRRMNATLEAMARAIFQSWFVDFDPVRAKLVGRQPTGLDAANAALFPNEFEDSELGPIPKGWGVVSLEDLASVRGGKQLPTEDCLPAGKFPVFGANGIMGYATRSTHEGFVIAFGRVGVYCGSVHWSLDGAWINNNASAVVPLRWPTLVLQTMLNIDFDSMRTGSAQPFIPNSSLASAKVLCPSQQIAEAFCRIVEPLRRQQADNEKQSRTLASVRDALLPKLLSGELCLPAKGISNHA